MAKPKAPKLDFTKREIIHFVGSKDIGESVHRKMMDEAKMSPALKKLRDALSTWRVEQKVELVAITLPEGVVTEKLMADANTQIRAALADNAWVVLIGRPAQKD